MNKLAKVLRVIAVVMLGLTAAVTLLSGVGTTCVAFGAEKYESMAGIVPYKPLYQAFVFLTIAVGVAAIVVTVGFSRGQRWSYGGSLLILMIGILVGGTHMYFSNMLRGSSMPADMRVYLSVLTMALLLALRIPGVWQGLDWRDGGGRSGMAAGGTALIVAGLATLSAPLWATPTHVFDGRNWAHFIDAPLLIGGGILLLAGLGVLLAGRALVSERAAQPVSVVDGSGR